MPDVLSGLIWVQTVCKGYQQVTLGKEIHIFEQRHEISVNVVCATSKDSDQPNHTPSLIRASASRLNILRLLSY